MSIFRVTGFLNVTWRELLAASRNKITYRTRWITGAGFCVFLLWLSWVNGGLRQPGIASRIFNGLATAALFYTLLLTAARAADSVSSERRQGTLGLLFLTNLNSTEILGGKICANALAASHGLLAVFPILALPLLFGGITPEQFWRTVLALLSGAFFAIAIGFAASVRTERQFSGVSWAIGFSIVFTIGLTILPKLSSSTRVATSGTVWTLSQFSPLTTLIAAGHSVRYKSFWNSLLAVQGFSWSLIGVTVLVLSRSWRDRPQTQTNQRLWRTIVRSLTQGKVMTRVGFRRRLLAINPIFWLASRWRVSAPVFLLLAVVIVLINVRMVTAFSAKCGVGHSTRCQVISSLGFGWFSFCTP